MNNNDMLIPVTVIIPTYNRISSLKRTIKHISEKQGIPEQIIIVDQTRDLETRSETKDFLDSISNISIIYLQQPVPSLTAARNYGLKYAKNDIVVYMDDDVDVNEDTIENIYLKMSRPDVAMVGAIDESLPKGGNKLGYLFGMKSFKMRNIGHVTKAMLGRYPDTIENEVETMWAMGFCFAIKKSLTKKWGIKFDELLTGYAYAEDLDFTYRYYKYSKKEKLKCLLSDDIRVIHLESKEYRIPSRIATYKYVINREYLCYKHKEGMLGLFLCRWANIGQFIFRVINHAEPLDVFRAQVRCDLIRRKLKQGYLCDDFFEGT